VPSWNEPSDWIPRFLEGLQFNVEITFGAFAHVVVGLLVALTRRVVVTDQGVTVESVVPSEVFKNEGRTNSPLPLGRPSPIGRLADMSIRPQLKRANPVQTTANLIRPRHASPKSMFSRTRVTGSTLIFQTLSTSPLTPSEPMSATRDWHTATQA
jgi:hypothetical protein